MTTYKQLMAEAKLVNIGSAKYPLHAKATEKLSTKSESGATHHIDGFVPPTNSAGDHMIYHNGSAYTHTGKTGKTMKTGEHASEYHNDEDARVWVTHKGHVIPD